MTETESSAARASAALDKFSNNEMSKSAEAAARAFEVAGERIERALIKAAQTGEISFQEMAQSVLRDLAKLAVNELITSPLQTVLGTSGATQGRAEFQTKPAMNVTLNVSGVSDASGFARSQGQISAALARAVSDGQRFF